MASKAKHFLPLLYMASLLAAIWLVTVPRLTGDAPVADAQQFSYMAYNLAQSGVLSAEPPTAGVAPHPGFRREPLYPALLAVPIKLLPQANAGACLSGQAACPDYIRALKRLNVALDMLLALVAFGGTWLMTGSPLLALAGATMVAGCSGFIELADSFLNESLAASLLLLTSVGLARARGAKDRYGAVCAGLSGGLLILTKAAFFYLLLPALAALPVLALLVCLRRLEPIVLRRVFVVIALAMAVCAPWLWRNHTISGHWAISGRGDDVLSIRAEYDTMPWREYPAAWVQFTPGGGHGALVKLYGSDVAERFNRRNPASYYGRAKQLTGVTAARAKSGGISQEQAAWRVIRDHAAMHVALTPAFAWGATFLPEGEHMPWALKIFSAVLRFTLIPAAIILAVRSLWRRDWGWLLLLLPAAFSYIFHAVITHDIPRYTLPLAPIGAVALLVLAQSAWQNRRENAEGPTPWKNAA